MSKYILPILLLLLLNNEANAGSRERIQTESTSRRLFGFTASSKNISLAMDAPSYSTGCAALLLPQEYFANGTAHAEMGKWASDPEFNVDMKFYAAWKRAELALPEDRRPDEATLKAWVKEIWDGGRKDIRQWEGDEFVDYMNTFATAKVDETPAAGAGRADAATEGSDEAESVGTGEEELTVLGTPGLGTPVPAVVTPPSPTPEEIAAIAARDAAEAEEAAERTRQFELRLAEEARALQAQREAEAREAAIRALEEERRAAATRIQAAGRGYNAKQLVKGLRRDQALAAAARAEEERLAEIARIEAARALQERREAEAREAAMRALEEERIAEAVAAETRDMVEAREAAKAKQRLRELLEDTKARIGALTARRDAAEAIERAERVKKWLGLKAQAEGILLAPAAINAIAEASKATKDPLTQFYVVANSSLNDLLTRPGDLFATTSVAAFSIAYPAGKTPTVAQAQQVYARRDQIIQSLWERFRLNPEGAPNILRTSYFQNIITRAMFAWDRAPSEIQSLVISLPWDRLLSDSTIFEAEEGATKAKGGAIAGAGSAASEGTHDEVWDDMACLRAVRLMGHLSRISPPLSVEVAANIVAAGAQAHGRTGIEIDAIFNAHALKDIIADPFGIFAPALDEKDKTTPKTAPLVRATLEALERVQRVMDWVRSHAAHTLIAPETMGAIEQAALQARGWTGAELTTLLTRNDLDPAFFGQFVAKLYGSMFAPREEDSSMDGAGGARSIKDIEKGMEAGGSWGGSGAAAGGAGAEAEKVVTSAVPAGSPAEAADIAIAMVESSLVTAIPPAPPMHLTDRTAAQETAELEAALAASTGVSPVAAGGSQDGADPSEGAPVGGSSAIAHGTAPRALQHGPDDGGAIPVASGALLHTVRGGSAVAVAQEGGATPGGARDEDPSPPDSFVRQAITVMARAVNALTGGILATPLAGAHPTEEAATDLSAAPASRHTAVAAIEYLPTAGLGGSPAGRMLPALDEADRA